MATEIVWNNAALQRFFTGKTEPVARDLARRAVNVESAAKRNSTGQPHGYYRGIVYPSAPYSGQGPGVRSGRLRGSVTWTLGEDAKGLYADVGASAAYAKYLEGTLDKAGPYEFLRPALKAAER